MLLFGSLSQLLQVFRLTFHKYIDKIGEEGSLVGYYAIHGDYFAIAACAICFVINWVLLCSFSEERQHQFALVRLLVFGLANVGCLGYIVALDANPSTTITHADIGTPYIFYRTASALNYEILFEFLPALLLDEREYLQGWCATVLVRMVLQCVIVIGIDALVDAVPLWVVILIQGALHFAFVVGAWLLHRHIRHEHEAQGTHNSAGGQPNQNAEPVRNEDANYVIGRREYHQGFFGYSDGLDRVRRRRS